jgi:hypothetical protein
MPALDQHFVIGTLVEEAADPPESLSEGYVEDDGSTYIAEEDA